MTAPDPNSTLAPGAGQGKASHAAMTDDFELVQRFAQLPGYARSLLRIKVPVIVTLATTRQPVSRVLELAPGSILHFGKPCDEPLTLSIGACEVAVGETVKVGDKFGLRITSMVMPQEKFCPVRPRQEKTGFRVQGSAGDNYGQPEPRTLNPEP